METNDKYDSWKATTPNGEELTVEIVRTGWPVNNIPVIGILLRPAFILRHRMYHKDSYCIAVTRAGGMGWQNTIHKETDLPLNSAIVLAQNLVERIENGTFTPKNQ